MGRGTEPQDTLDEKCGPRVRSDRSQAESIPQHCCRFDQATALDRVEDPRVGLRRALASPCDFVNTGADSPLVEPILIEHEIVRTLRLDSVRRESMSWEVCEVRCD